jgi:hypothetical protein
MNAGPIQFIWTAISLAHCMKIPTSDLKESVSVSTFYFLECYNITESNFNDLRENLDFLEPF